ncbi:DUF775-domain-containing protein [Fistulina hepatica ATCC 64428]|uniref:DUF775-domain-containing protein n=1 Tax=Fistulina hepatica ATCC 64428 TaxID=1128425 RepID=A0A0D7AED1_9AGAR|nr:DUF775-domain-containing protein [Fistulina hepatica ATCC 64428]
MFGCCVAGRPLQTNLQQIDETHAIFELPCAHSINHICVFLLGTVPFPEGYGATVHFFWPGKGFQLLGMQLYLLRLSNQKPSAIFRLRGTFSASATHGSSSFMSSSGSTEGDVTAVMGISIEPLDVIAANAPNGTLVPVVKTPDTTLLAERIVKHLVNYVSGFATSAITPDTAIPMGLIMRWYESFLSKIRAGGTGFLEREE